MSLNAYIFIALLLALLFSPLLLLSSPIWGAWLLYQWREKHRRGFRYIWPFMARTIAAYAEAMIPTDTPELPWPDVARNLDRYLAAYRSPRKWRILLVAGGLEFVPILALKPPFTWMGKEARRRFCLRYLTTSKGVWGKVAMGKQLIRLGYYSAREAHERMGFEPTKRWLDDDAGIVPATATTRARPGTARDPHTTPRTPKPSEATERV